MESSQILNSSLDDLIFEHRNKSYGAYYLRKIYSKNANTATIITLAAFLLAVSIPFFYIIFHKEPVIFHSKPTSSVLAPPPPMEKTTPPPPPPPNMPKPPKIQRFVPPVIVNTPPPPEEQLPTQQQVQETPPTVETDPNATYTIPSSGAGNTVVDDSKNKIFTFVEQEPEFPGGQEALLKYLQSHINYPSAAKSLDIEGVVVLTFVVDENGNITDIKPLREVGGGCTEEAVRVVKSMPAWKPGRQNGNNVKVQFNLPIRFTLATE